MALFAADAFPSAGAKAGSRVKPTAHVSKRARASARKNAPSKKPEKKSTVVVSAGRPSEFSFALSKREVPPGTITFKVTNRGKIVHTFEICVTPGHLKVNSCKGKVTRHLAPGKSSTLTVTISKKGEYQYLCTIPGHAAAGMKGALGVGVAPPRVAATPKPAPAPKPGPAPKPAPATTTAAATTAAATTAAATTTAAAPTTGDPAAGAAVFQSAGCGGCHTLKAAGATGTTGPNLDQLAPAEATIVSQVTNGGELMPSFEGVLTAQQIQDVAAYVYQSTH